MNFIKLSEDAEALLEKLCQAENPQTVLNEGRQKARDISETKETEFVELIKELKEAKCIQPICIPANNYTFYGISKDANGAFGSISMSIETYRKKLKEHKESLREVNASGSVTNIDNSTHNSLNIDGNNNALENVGVSSGNNKKPKSDKPNVLSKILEFITSKLKL